MPNSRLRFLMPRRAPGLSQQSTDLSAAPERSMDPRTREEPALAVQITIRWMRTNCAMVTPDTPCSGAAGRDNASAMPVLPKTRNSFSESQYSGTTPQRSPVSLLYET